MFDIFTAIKNNLEKPSPIINKEPKQFSNAPSRAMCYSEEDNKPLGSCIRSVYMSNKQYSVSNPTNIYVIMTSEAGRLWESWLTNQYKELGIYIKHSVKLYEKEYHMSGEFDILHFNPETDEVEITECKQYNGSNYYAAASIKGSKNNKPTPKDAHLMQCFDYLLMCRNSSNENIKTVNLVYIDRSCGNYSNNVQFAVTVHEDNGKLYPNVTYKVDGTFEESYIDYRISDKAIYNKNNMLIKLIDADILPPRDYVLCYDKQTIEEKVFKKEISAYKYKEYKSDPVKNPIGDWNCFWCQFGPDKEGFSTCWSLQD